MSQPHNRITIPNYPPPGLYQHQFHPSNLMFTEQPPIQADPSNIYKEQLSTYLRHRNSTKQPRTFKKHSKSIVKLSEVTIDFRHAYDLIESVKAEIENLSQTSTSFSAEEFQKKLSDLTQEKDELEIRIHKYSDLVLQSHIKDAIAQRKEKRHRIKLRKKETKDAKATESEIRKQKHEQIDHWLENAQQKIAEERRRSNAEKRAEHVLFDVNQRKAEAERFLKLFESLKELHRLRSKNSRDRRSADDETFHEEIGQLKEMWTTALKKYNEEEQRLKYFLNDNRSTNEWRVVLFGSSDSGHSSMTENTNKMKNLISIRKLWDEFLVSKENPFGSTIPIGWVSPNAAPTNAWSEFQNTNKK